MAALPDRGGPDELQLRRPAALPPDPLRDPVHWRTEIVAWTPPRGFVDVQRLGPFLLWEHTHRLTPVEGGTEIYDHVRYRLFLGPVGALVRRLLVRSWLDRIFDYRAEQVPGLLTPAPVARPRRTR